MPSTLDARDRELLEDFLLEAFTEFQASSADEPLIQDRPSIHVVDALLRRSREQSG
jgi:hypothetical protein